jgi:hypothetical protein
MTDVEPRTSPLFSQLVLWVGFGLLVVASIFTVLVPALSEGGDEQVEGGAEPEEAPQSGEEAAPPAP